MHIGVFILGCVVAGTMLWDAFETIVLPRTAVHKIRLARIYYRLTWGTWSRLARLSASDSRRERFLGVYGPLALIGLLGIWAVGLIAGFASIQWALRPLGPGPLSEGWFIDDFYMSGTTLFTLGLGDVVPHGGIARLLTVVEAGTGAMFLTMMLAYLPVMYGSFSRREGRLTLLDARAGSPPAAAEVLLRLAKTGDLSPIHEFFKEWEAWCSDLLESHISHPVIAYFRSQHQRQSWVAALTTVLDVSALVKVGVDNLPTWQAHLTFAIARHAAVDLSQVLGAHPHADLDRLPADQLAALRAQLAMGGVMLNDSPEADRELEELRRSYEPYVIGLSRRLVMPVPPWRHVGAVKDNWQTSPRGRIGAHL